MSNLLEQHPHLTIFSIIGLVVIILLYRYFKIKLLGDRNIWDLSLFPGVTKLFWTGEWPIVFATGLLILVAVLAITTRPELWDMFKVNLGVVFGTCVRWVEYKIQDEKKKKPEGS